jgi:hypothetical protein
MRVRTVGIIAGLAGLAVPAGAGAAPPIMPLGEVQPGMRCTGLSVFKGQQIESFNVEILDVIGEAETGTTQPRLLVRVSGGKVEATGVGPGFSGSPIYCTGSDGVSRNVGAISETIGDYGGKQVLATPIEQIVGTPVEPPKPSPTSPREELRDARLLARARSIASPISVGGLDPALGRALSASAQRRGLALVPMPSVPSDNMPILPLEPGSAMGVGLSSGDVTVSGIGTVSYVDGDKLWAYGHQFDAAGARDLLLQDAYVATIINSPLQIDFFSTYKLAGAVHDLGTISNDAFDAVAGRLGALPPVTAVNVSARDDDRGLRREMNVAVADEAGVDNPTGYTGLSFIAPLAVSQVATDAFGAAPQRASGLMCLRVTLREIDDPLRFCNRYVSDGTGFGETVGLNPVALSAGTDAGGALSIFDGYKGKPVEVLDVSAWIRETRGQRQAYLRNITLPRRIHRGDTVPVRLVARIVRGNIRVFHFKWKVPGKLELGKHKLDFRGTDPDSGFGFFFDELIIDFLDGGGSYFDSEGPRSVQELADQFRATARWDGVRVKGGGRVYRDDTYRIGGRARPKVTVLKKRR